MAKKTPLNGALKWIAVGLAVASACVAIVTGYNEHDHQIADNSVEIEEHEQANVADHAEMEGENGDQWLAIDINTGYVTADEVDTEYIKRDIATIQRDVAGLKQGMDDFATEQREMNREILSELRK